MTDGFFGCFRFDLHDSNKKRQFGLWNFWCGWKIPPTRCVIFIHSQTQFSQHAGGIFYLDQKFQRPNCLFWLHWCKTSLKQPKNSSVNRFPFKISFLHRDFRKIRYKFPSFYSQKSYLEGKPVDRWFFWLIQTCFASM